jgi:TonB family protein
MIVKTSGVALLLVIALTIAQGQNNIDVQQNINVQSDLPPNGVMAGPYGHPLEVLDEGGQWSIPIQVYADAVTREYVPDITTPGWIQWHIQEFKEDGTYMTVFYVYNVKNEQTTRAILDVDTRKKTAFLSVPLTAYSEEINLAGPSTARTKAIARITAIVEERAAKFQGPTIQQVLVQQRQAVAQMVARAHGEIPSQTDTMPNGIVPPRVLNSVEAKFTDYARRNKISGIVMLSSVIDVNGIPQDIKVTKSLDSGLDQEAIKAAHQYRFSPAFDTVKGIAVPQKITITVNFRLY